jgi:hypothetical protein
MSSVMEGLVALAAIYYPYSRSIVGATLKKAVLLFDTLYFLDSEPWFIRTAITRNKAIEGSERAKVDQLENDYNLLREEGFVQNLDAAGIAHEHDELLTINLINDISNDEFCKVAIESSADTWSILRERIPPTLLKTLYPGAGTFSEAISLQALIEANGDPNLIANEHDRRFASFRWNPKALTRDSAMEEFLKSRYRYVIGGNPHIELPSYEFPFLHASSLRINECLIAAALNGYVPYTESRVHDSLLRLKVDRALTAIDTQPELKRRLSIDLPLRFPMQSLAVEVVDRLIPDDVLNRLAVKDLLLYRSRNEKLLRRFHCYLEMLSAEIGDVIPGDEYNKRVRRIVSSKMLPELQKARDDLVASYEDAFGGIAVSSGVGVLSAVSVTVFGGLDLWHVLLAGALAEGVVLATKAPTELLKAWKGRRESGRSPMAYVAGVS